jgi:phosphatidylglycerophosphate synthase
MGRERAHFGDSLQQLRDAQKSSKGAPLYSLVVNRPMGRVLAATSHQVGLTPNQVTAISAVFTFSGIGVLALAPSSRGAGIVVALLLVLGYGLDAADGQLARLRGGGSPVGEWFDHLTDSVKVVVLHLAVAVAMFRWSSLSPLWLLVPLVFAASSSVHFFGMVLVDLLGREQRARTGRAGAVQAPSLLRTTLKLPMDYGLLCLSFVLLGWHEGFLGVYTVLAAGSTGYLVLVVGKWTRDIRAMAG